MDGSGPEAAEFAAIAIPEYLLSKASTFRYGMRVYVMSCEDPALTSSYSFVEVECAGTC